MHNPTVNPSYPFRLGRVFARHAGKISFGLGITASLLQVANRSYMSGAPVVDKMTLSGAFLFASCIVCAPADRWPWLKRVSGTLGLPYLGLLVADAHGKDGFASVVAGTLPSAMVCLSMIFERKAARSPASATPASGLVAAFKQAPLLYTSAVSVAAKMLMLSYAIANREALFIPAVILGTLANATTGIMDNSVRRFFGVEEQKKSPVPTLPAPRD